MTSSCRAAGRHLIAANLHPVFGIKAEFSGLYAKNTLYEDLRYNGFSFMAGPQVSGRGRTVTTFAHALFGVEHLGASAPFLGLRVGASLNAFSMAIGGGVDWHGRRRIAWRVVQAEYFPWRAFDGMAHNIRISIGIVVRFR